MATDAGTDGCETHCCSTDMVSKFFNTMTTFGGAVIGGGFKSLDNPVGKAQAATIVQFWVGFATSVVSFSYQSPALVVQTLVAYCFWSWVNWFGLIDRLGCIWCVCCCFEGNIVLLVTGLLDIFYGAYTFYGSTQLSEVVGLVSGFANGIILMVLGALLILVFNTPLNQRKADLQKTLLLDTA
jgi:hypothetical protein